MWQLVMVLAVGSFMVVLDTTIVNIALPRIITPNAAGHLRTSLWPPASL